MISVRRSYAGLYNKFEELAELVEKTEDKIADNKFKEEDKYLIFKKVDELKYKLNQFSASVRDIKILK